MSGEVGVLVLGNSFAARVQLPALRWAGGSRVRGIAGRELSKAEATAREFGIEHASDDWRALLELGADLVLVTTPVHLHREMALAALRTGAAVLCEKPFALDAAEAAELREAARGRPAWIDHELRWSPHLRALRERVAAGDVGEPRHAAIEMFLPPARYRDREWSWWFDASRGGGILGALGSHLVDALRFTLGEVRAVHARLASFVDERTDAEGVPRPVTADEHAALQLELAGGAFATLETSIAVPSERFFRLQVAGSEGCLRMSGPDELLVGPLEGPLEPVAVDPLPTCKAMGLPEYGLFGRCLPPYLRDLVAAVAAGEELPLAATFEDGLACQRVLDAARRSSAAGGGFVACGPDDLGPGAAGA